MGQISLPVLNRTGYSMFWYSLWDDKLNYNRNWKEDHVIRKILNYVFLKRWTKHRYFYTSKIIKNSIILQNKNTFLYFSDPINLIKTISKINKDKKIHLSYVLRVWIMKFQKYIVIYFFLFTPKPLNLILEGGVHSFKKTTQLVNFLYYRFLNRVNKNYFKETQIFKEQF